MRALFSIMTGLCDQVPQQSGRVSLLVKKDGEGINLRKKHLAIFKKGVKES